MVQEPRMPIRWDETRNMVAMANLDPRMNDDVRMEPREEMM